jgi:hypothetical protein
VVVGATVVVLVVVGAAVVVLVDVVLVVVVVGTVHPLNIVNVTSPKELGVLYLAQNCSKVPPPTFTLADTL